MYYIHQDHLGSYNVITTDNKAVSERHHFDPWGNRRNPTNWLATDTRTSFLFDQGFTGHEHLDAFKIINMNARLYDPVIGRFFSPDPYVQAPELSQAFNRYSYCLNNPLKYTDPSGESWLFGDNPIFDYYGEILGTDDLGIQGKAIIMNKGDFRQGMSHDEAMQKGRTLDNIFVLSQNVIDKINEQLQTFPARPDWDGIITDAEARNWWKNGNGQSLYVDQSKIKLAPVTTKDFRNKSTITHNFFFDIVSDKDVGRVYGTLTLTLLNPNTGEVKLGSVNNAYIDTYDFNSGGSFIRNIATWGARRIAGEGTPFKIYGWGNNPRIKIK